MGAMEAVRHRRLCCRPKKALLATEERLFHR
jgi:hypothetical protein